MGKDGKFIDNVIMITFWSSLRSQEDVTEIYCHGSPAVVEDILNHLAAISGFRLAEAGEFCRTLDNDKTDITSIEGLADLIDADTPWAETGCARWQVVCVVLLKAGAQKSFPACLSWKHH